MTYRYTPYYCEENIYLLAEKLSGTAGAAFHVLFITNAGKSCMLLHQKAAGIGKPVFWDYHVILLSGSGPDSQVLDLDTRLGFPCAAPDYLARTFPSDAPEELRPLFKVIPAETYLDGFSSDRRHMRSSDGAWLKPPPEWPCLSGKRAASPHELEHILDVEAQGWGRVLDMAAMQKLLDA
jgi:hypothetical protein